jgi:DNA polymerase IV
MDTILSETIGFNKAPPTILLLDINSCFATIEQQANPLLRGKPVVVGAYTTNRGCVLAASREAKKLGIKTGMYVGQAKLLCPSVIVLPCDPEKYRFVHQKLVALLHSYTDKVEVKSIDEMIVVCTHAPALSHFQHLGFTTKQAMVEIAKQIKIRIKEEIGEWITVSIGIAPNRYLAKIGAGYQKPDGLTIIDSTSIEQILKTVNLEDLTGIKHAMGTRLRHYGISTSWAFYSAPILQLKTAFHSILGYQWWLRLHGWEADDREFERKSIGHSYALHTLLHSQDPHIAHILYQLTVKMGSRLRSNNFTARGIAVFCYFADHTGWGKRETQPRELFCDTDLYTVAVSILKKAPDKPVRILAVSSFHLKETLYAQQSFLPEDQKQQKITKALDAVAARWGSGVVVPGRFLTIDQKVMDRIGFGKVHDMTELPIHQNIE